MKHMKKMMALVIAMVMMFAMTIPAMAASITIKQGDDVTGTVTTEYTYYELLEASIDGDNVVYYLPVSEKGTALKELLKEVTYTKGADLDSKTVTPFSFVQSADGMRWNAVISDDVGEDDGELLATALNTDAIKNAALTSGKFQQNAGSAVADNLDPGYYLITSNLGSKLVLKTLNNETIDTKNEYFTDTKTANKTNMEVGDTVTYTITIHIPDTVTVGDEITVHDTLDSHLAIVEDTIKANFDGKVVTLSDGTKKDATETFAKKFTVTEEMLGGDVVITYDAELLSTAANDTGYVNSSFANDSAYETVPSEVKVYTFDIVLNKTFSGVSDEDANDYRATFELRRESPVGSAIQFTRDETGYVIADSDDENVSTDLIVTGGAPINIRGLAAGTYYLVETATATGYNLPTDSIVVTINDTTTGTQPEITPSHTVNYTFGEQSGNGTINITNQTGSILPSTGGMGTTIFYVLGAILVLGAAVLLIAKKRMSNEN